MKPIEDLVQEHFDRSFDFILSDETNGVEREVGLDAARDAIILAFNDQAEKAKRWREAYLSSWHKRMAMEELVSGLEDDIDALLHGGVL